MNRTRPGAEFVPVRKEGGLLPGSTLDAETAPDYRGRHRRLAYRGLADDGTDVVMACWPGAQGPAPTTWIEWLRTGDDQVRKQAIPNLVRGRWELGPWAWQRTTLVSHMHAGDYFSVNRYLADDLDPPGWYVNFELPYRRTAIGFDTFDLLLDLIVAADRSTHWWKDEDEYDQARRLGLITDAVHAHVDTAREEVLSLAHAGQGPFTHDWSRWRPSPAWPVPTLPGGSLTWPAEP